jgi:antitoxin VapB
VRLPKGVAFPEGVRRVDVAVVGQSRVLTPTGSGWDEWFASLEPFGEDFLAERSQGEAEDRDVW